MEAFLTWCSENPAAATAIVGLITNAIIKYTKWNEDKDLIQIILGAVLRVPKKGK